MGLSGFKVFSMMNYNVLRGSPRCRLQRKDNKCAENLIKGIKNEVSENYFTFFFLRKPTQKVDGRISLDCKISRKLINHFIVGWNLQ